MICDKNDDFYSNYFPCASSGNGKNPLTRYISLMLSLII